MNVNVMMAVAGDAIPRVLRFKQIKAVFETLVVREDVGTYFDTSTRYMSAEQVHSQFRFLNNETKEHFFVLHLDGKNRIVAVDHCSTGSLNQSIVHPREVFKVALLSSAAAVILMHNHPTGDPTPSGEDIEITRRMKECGELLGIKVLDHIIIGDKPYSFAEHGVL